MRGIAATWLLALLLMAGQAAGAAKTAGTITMSCDGTVRSGPGPGEVERVSTVEVVVNLAEHIVTVFDTTTGSAVVANIVRVDDTKFEFTGGSAPGGSSFLFGTIDRATAAATVYTTTWARDKVKGSAIIQGLSYYLVCKATNRLR